MIQRYGKEFRALPRILFRLHVWIVRRIRYSIGLNQSLFYDCARRREIFYEEANLDNVYDSIYTFHLPSCHVPFRAIYRSLLSLLLHLLHPILY